MNKKIEDLKEVKSELKQTPETIHYTAVIKKLLEINKAAQASIQQNNWTIKCLRAGLKVSLLAANKK